MPGARISLGGADLAALPAHEIVEAGLALVPEDRGIFPDLSRAREPAARRLLAPRARARGRQPAARAGPVPAARRAHGPARPHHERRRAADGGDRPRADVEPATSCCSTSPRSASRRWCARSCSSAGAHQGAGRRRAAGRAERHAEPRRSPAAAICWRTAASSARAPPRDLQDDPAVRRAYLGGACGSRQRAPRGAATAALRNWPHRRRPVAAARRACRRRRLAAASTAHRRQRRRAAPTPPTIASGSEPMFDVDLMINNAECQGRRRRHLRPAQPDDRRGRLARGRRRASRMPGAPPMRPPPPSRPGRRWRPAARRALLNKAADLLEAGRRQVRAR